MIEIKTFDENEHGYHIMIHVEGDAAEVVQQLTSIFDRIYLIGYMKKVRRYLKRHL